MAADLHPAALRIHAEALKLCRVHEPDLLILDLHLPDIGGAALVRLLQEEGLRTRTMIYTGSRHERALANLLRAKPHGIVHKEDSLPPLWQAIQTVAKGGRYVSPTFGAVEERATAASPSEQLTGREEAVLKMIGGRLLNKVIADRLGVALKTLEHIREKLRAKLGLRDAAELALEAMRRGLVE